VEGDFIMTELQVRSVGMRRGNSPMAKFRDGSQRVRRSVQGRFRRRCGRHWGRRYAAATAGDAATGNVLPQQEVM